MWEQAFQDFLLSRKAENRTQKTISYYQQCWDTFKKHAGEEPEITKQSLQKYIVSLRDTHNPTGVATRWRGLRVFLTFAYTEGYSTFDPTVIKNPRAPKPEKQPLTLEEMNKMLKGCVSARDRALVALIFDTGLRAKEVCGLREQDVDLTQYVVYVQEGKGGKQRSVPFSYSTLKYLRTWIAGRDKRSVWFFHTHDTLAQIHPDWLYKMMCRIAKRAKFKDPHIGPHRLRHTFATQFISNGGNPLSLQKILGHSSMTVTERYVNMDLKTLMEHHQTSSPMDKLKMRDRR